MKITTHWKLTPNFPDRYQREWGNLSSYLEELAPADECYVSDLDWGNHIRIIFEDEGSITGVLEYHVDELSVLTIDQFIDDIKGMPRFPSTKECNLIQLIFNEFKNVGKWPNSRELSVKARNLGPFFDMTKEIGPNYVRVYDEREPKSITRLTIRGADLCDSSKEYISLFMQALKVLIETYIERPTSPVITANEFIEQGIIQSDQVEMLYWMIMQERDLCSGAFNNHEYTDVNFRISHEILRYENITGLGQYLRKQRPIKSKGEDVKIEKLPLSAVAMSREGIEVIRRNSDIEYQYDLFISYSSKDQDVADAIHSALDEVDLVPFLAPKDIDSGDIGSEQIRKALLNSAEVAVLMSPNSINSLWVITEWGAAWVLRKRITPILLECKIEDIPKLLQDMQKRDYPSEIDRFIKEALKRKTNAP